MNSIEEREGLYFKEEYYQVLMTYNRDRCAFTLFIGCLPHVGIVPDHCPLASQVRVSSPDKKTNPSLQV